MTRNANPVVVGGFVAGAAALVVAAVALFGGTLLFQERYRFVLFFDGSVKGLTEGAPVVFRGVRIGTVQDIRVRIDPRTLSVHLPVTIEVEPDRLVQSEAEEEGIQRTLARWINRGLAGQLVFQSLVTGQLMVDLDFHPGKTGHLAGIPMGFPEIPTIPTPFQELARTVEELPLQEIVNRAARTLAGIERVVNSADLAASLRSAREAMGEVRRLAVDTRRAVGPALVKADGAIEDARKAVRGVDTRVATLADEAEGTLADARALVQRLDARLADVADGVDATMRDTRILVQRVDSRVDPLAQTFDATLSDARALLRHVDARVDPVLTRFEEAARDAGQLARDADRDLEPLLKSLRQASDRAADALDQAGQVLGSVRGRAATDSPLGHEISEALREFSAAARSFRVLADALEQRPEALLRGKTPTGAR